MLFRSATTTFFSAGKIGQALKFDGVDDYVELPASSTLIPNNQSFSVALWAKPTRLSASNHRFITFANGAGLSAFNISYTPASQSVAFGYRDSGGTNHLNGAIASSTVGTWFHVVVTYNGTSYLGYVNGILGTTTNNTIVTLSSDPAAIGANTGGTTNFTAGLLDDVRVYNRVLSAQEIQQLYSMGR